MQTSTMVWLSGETVVSWVEKPDRRYMLTLQSDYQDFTFFMDPQKVKEIVEPGGFLLQDLEVERETR